MTNLINNFNKNLQTIFLCLLFYGLSISIFLKEINLILLQNFDLKLIVLYRILIIFFSIYFFFHIKKKLNIFLTIYLLIFFLFLYNSFFGQKFYFTIDPLVFYKSINISHDAVDTFFQNKNRVIIISIFNVILPLLIFSINKDFKINIEKFKNASLIICNLFLYSLSIFVFYKFLMIKFNMINLNEAFINLHSMIYILNIQFILLCDKLKKKNDKFNFKILLNFVLILLCFFVTEAIIHFFISLFGALIFLSLDKLNKKFIILFAIIFSAIILIIYSIISSYELEIIQKYIDFREPGGIANSVYVRIMNITYYLFYTEKLNILIGNNLFINDIYTYPHNIFIDIYICTGLIGLLVISVITSQIIKKLKFNLNQNNIFIFIIMIQSFIFSNFSGFLFTNIIFNTSLAACLCLVKEKESLITANS